MADAGERIGQQLGNYRLLRLLGRGAFAEVYLGEHIHLGTQAAVKVLYAKVDHDGMAAFRAEARTIASLGHPSIVRVLDFGVDGNTPFLVMDYASGGTLRTRYPRGTRLPLAAIVSYVQQIASALQYAHERRLVHRDIKPENLLVGRSNEVLLGDFGIALLAQSSRYLHPQDVAGTIAYMAPEQIQSYPRPASDQYSLGIVVYEWLGGEVPFQGAFTDIAVKHALVPPPSLREKIPALSPFVEQVVLTALAKDPQQRFPTVRAFASALKQAGEAVEQRSQTLPVSDSAQYPPWQSTYVNAPSEHSLQPALLNTVPTTTIPDTYISPTTPLPGAYSSPTTPFPDTNLPPFPGWTPTPEAVTSSVSTRESAAPRSFMRSTPFKVALIAVVCLVLIASFAGFLFRLTGSPPSTSSFAKLVVDHAVFDFGKIEKGAKASFDIGLSNTGESVLNWTADAGKATWLQVQTSSGIIASGGKVLDNLTINTATLPPGNSSALLTINSNGGNVQVQVKVEVFSGPKEAILTVSTKSLNFGRVASSNQIPPQPVLVSNTGILALNWKADVGNATWLALDPGSGMIQSGGSPQTINVKVQAGLATGSYSAILTISSNGGKQSMQVNMVVIASPGPQPSPTGTLPSSTLTSTLPSPTPTNTPTHTPIGTNTPTPIVASDDWQMFGYNPQHTNFNPNEQVLSPSNISSLVLQWKQQSRSARFIDSPAVANGIVYVGSADDNVYAFNATTGALDWTAATGNGIASYPTVANGIVYIGGRDNTLYAFNASTGATIWTAHTANWNYDAPTVAGGIVYFGSSDGHLYALNAQTGTLLWSAAVGGVIEWSSPAVANGIVYVGARDGGLHAFNAQTGAPLWTTPVGNDGDQSPAVANGIVYIGSADHNVYALNAQTGQKIWTASTGDVIKDAPAIVNGTVYIGSNDGKLYAFDAQTGSLLWNVTAGSAVASPAVANGVVYFNSIGGNVYAVNAAGCGSPSCVPLWTYSTGDMYPSSPVIANGILYDTFTQLYTFHLS